MAKFPLSMLLFLASVSLVNAACETSVVAGTTSYCCLSSTSSAFSYEIDDNNSYDSYSTKVVPNRYSTSHFLSAQCAYNANSDVCTGACNSRDDCEKAGTVQSSDHDKFCLALTCDNLVYTCVFDSVTFTGTPVASSSTSSSGDCKCSCCSSNSCTASVVGYFNAGSSSSCTDAACRTQFPSQCPSVGSSGTVSSLYTSPTSPAVGARSAAANRSCWRLSTLALFASMITFL
jgi:hypothetical protein